MIEKINIEADTNNYYDLKYRDTLKKLGKLEIEARKLEPAMNEREEIFGKTQNYINQFVERLPGSKAYRNMECNNLQEFRIEEDGKDFDQLINVLSEEVDQAGINSASGKHFGYIPGGGIWSSAVADMLAAAANRYVGIYYSSPGGVIIENQLIRWLCSVVGYPESYFRRFDCEPYRDKSSKGCIQN